MDKEPRDDAPGAPTPARFREMVIEAIGRPDLDVAALAASMKAMKAAQAPGQDLLQEEIEALEVDGPDKDARVSPRAARSLARNLAWTLKEQEEAWEGALGAARGQFLEQLFRAMAWSVEAGVADDPDLDVAEWMDAAMRLDLGVEARDWLLRHGRPDTHARWLEAALPLDRAWKLALDTLAGLASRGRAAQALAWVPALLASPVSSWGRMATPEDQPGTLAKRCQEALRAWWGRLAGGVGSPSGPVEEIMEQLARAVPVGLADVAWTQVLFGEEGSGLGKTSLPEPHELAGRVCALLRRHPDLAEAWLKEGNRHGEVDSVDVVVWQNFVPKASAHKARETLSNLASTRGGASCGHIEAVMAGMDASLEAAGLPGGYANAWRAGILEARLASAPRLPRTRL